MGRGGRGGSRLWQLNEDEIKKKDEDEDKKENLNRFPSIRYSYKRYLLVFASILAQVSKEEQTVVSS